MLQKFWQLITLSNPDSKDHGANMGPIWGRQDPGGPHVGPMNFAIWECLPNSLKHFNFIVIFQFYPSIYIPLAFF